MQHLCLIGGNITKKIDGLLCLCQFRHTILFWMEYKLDNLWIDYRDIWMNYRRECSIVRAEEKLVPVVRDIATIGGL